MWKTDGSWRVTVDHHKLDQVMPPVLVQFFWNVTHLFMGRALYLTFRGLLRLESNYRHRSKWVGGVSLEENQHRLAWQLPE